MAELQNSVGKDNIGSNKLNKDPVECSSSACKHQQETKRTDFFSVLKIVVLNLSSQNSKYTKSSDSIDVYTSRRSGHRSW